MLWVYATKSPWGQPRQQMAAFWSVNAGMTIFAAAAVLLASSLASPSPDHVRAADVERNPMLGYAAVDHDLAKVKRRIERALHSSASDSTAASSPPAITR
ncbi:MULTISPECIES: hypothetical protein [Bradyrhizobium]|uniref:hypothetical protein n=1 Tax=Bradyrhizobium TaxID=374 RepID=UPI001EDA5019|nr:hypothetical protein [Bradyrhizobium zhengyangense]MCG2645564.1 hypothetical protein [Bradyrhizobium zhengyangense]